MSTISDSIRYEVKNWWWFLIAGLLSIAAGFIIFARPVQSYVSLSILFSLIMTGTGISQIFFALSVSGVMRGWGWTLVSGILDFAIGIYLLTYPTVTMATLPFFVGFYLIFRSIYLIGCSIDLSFLGVGGWGWLTAGGIALLTLGMITLRYPVVGAAGIVGVSGSAFILSGIFSMVLAFQLKNLKGQYEKPERGRKVSVKEESQRFAQ